MYLFVRHVLEFTKNAIAFSIELKQYIKLSPMAWNTPSPKVDEINPILMLINQLLVTQTICRHTFGTVAVYSIGLTLTTNDRGFPASISVHWVRAY